MTILNIHGYKGSPENSAKKILDQFHCYEVLSPALNYDRIPPVQMFAELNQIVQEQTPDVLVGTSYGGFFAASLCAKYRIPAILVSPCLLPFVQLPRLGCEWSVKNYFPVFSLLSELNVDLTATIIGDQDEIIDTHDFTRNFLENPDFMIYPDGMHSGATLPLQEFFSKILKEFSIKYDFK
ncbi:MAG: hypothetical protein K2G25_02830 [Oscillospiraceae bacterium]|nr:hypothetical protein [Oscillospiraceae bacterium]